jgi:hypothetical protein
MPSVQHCTLGMGPGFRRDDGVIVKCVAPLLP